MTHLTASLRRQIAVITVIAMIPMAAMLIVMSDLLTTKRQPVAIPYALTASIDESSSTVGMADSHIWELTLPNGQPDFAAMDEHLQAMQDLGIDTVRVIIPWRGNEPWGPPGTLPAQIEEQYWARSDYIIQQAAERGMAVLGVLNHAPEWGGADPAPWATLGFEEAPDPQLYAEYAARVVARYGDMVGAYEIWNEPNALTGWAPEIDPAAYTEVLKAAWAAIKGPDGPDENDPLVVAGVLGAVVTFGNLTLDPRTFVETMYDEGAKGFFDALSFHPYHYSLKFSEGEATPQEPWKANSPLEQVIAIRQLMLENGDAALRIWATEYGLPTFGGITEDQQKQYIQDFLEAWKDLEDEDGTSYAGPAFLYTLRDAFVNGEITEATALGLFKFDAIAGKWVMKEAAKWLQEYLNADPTDPPEQPGSGNPIAAALQLFFKQMQIAFRSIQASFQNFASSINAMMASVARAIAAIFRPGGVGAASLPPEVQDDFAEGTRMVAVSMEAGTSDAVEPASETDSTPALDVAPAVEVDEAQEVTESTEVTEASEVATPAAPATAMVETEDAEPATAPTDTTPTPTEEPTVDPVEDAVAEDDTDSDVVETDDVAAESDTDTLPATESETKSREPVRTGLVARPGVVGDGDSDDSDDSPDASTTEPSTAGGDTEASDGADSDSPSDAGADSAAS